MSMTPSLKNRVKRLEQAASVGTEPTLTDFLIAAERRRTAQPDDDDSIAEAFQSRFASALANPRPGGVVAVLREAEARGRSRDR